MKKDPVQSVVESVRASVAKRASRKNESEGGDPQTLSITLEDFSDSGSLDDVVRFLGGFLYTADGFGFMDSAEAIVSKRELSDEEALGLLGLVQPDVEDYGDEGEDED